MFKPVPEETALRTRLSISAGAALAAFFGASVCADAAPDRISGRIETGRYVALEGNAHALARPEFDAGPVEADARISGVSLHLRPSPQQQAELGAFLEEQRNPASPDYQNWLTPEQFGDRFGASSNDIQKIVSWLEGQGLTIEHVGSGKTWVLFGGTAGQIGRTFHTSLRHYRVNGALHFANASGVSVPEALGELVSSIAGLDDFRPQPMARARTIEPQFNRGGYHYLGPDDVAAIYDVSALYKAGIDGSGQKLAIAGQTDINLLDIKEFRGLFDIPPNVPKVVLVGKDPGTSSNDQLEADLDIEWAGAVARNATIIYVNSNNVFTSLEYAIDQNLAPVVSVSYGACETGAPASFRTLAQQASAQGITWMNASGDQGAAGCDYGVSVASNGPSVIFPADIPEVVAVGGTEFSETANQGWSSTNSATNSSASGYIPEEAWNDTSAGYGIEASGGGASALFRKPWWQTGPGVPNDNARDVPDVALAASAGHDPYIVVTSDTMMAVGGTSAASPSFAGMVALLNQYLVSTGAIAKPGLGNINPTLYALAPVSSGIFHDITAGDNIVPCAAGSKGCANGSFGYIAGPGYDLVTGLGSIDAYKLAAGWLTAPGGVGVTMSVTASPASIAPSASTRLTALISAVSGKAPPTGTAVFMLDGTPIGSAALATGGASAATAGFTVKGGILTTGGNTISVSYVPTGSFRAATGTVTVTVTAPIISTSMTLTANPANIAASGGTLLTAIVKASGGGVTGSVKFTLGSTTLGSAPITGSAAALTVKAASLAIGANLITATYIPGGGLAASSATTTVDVAPPPVATTLAVTASPSTIATSASTTLTAVIRAVSGTVAPTGTITFSRAGVILGSQAVSNSSAAFNLKGASLAAGQNNITASFLSTGSFLNSTAGLTVTVASPQSPASHN